MQITITNNGSVPAEYELGVLPKVLLQPGESIAVDLLPQQPVIVRVPENLVELEEKARELAEARALVAEAEKAEKAARKAAKKAAEQQNGDETDEAVTDPADGEQKPDETGEEGHDLFQDQTPQTTE